MEVIRRWRNDWRVWRWCRQNDLISDVDQQDWYRRQSADPKIKMYAVCAKGGADAEGKEQDLIVGVCGLTDLDWISGTAEFSLYIAPDLQGTGLGEQALRVLLAHAFTNLNLSQIYGEVLEGNPAIKMFKSVGFQTDGRRRQFYFKDGKLLLAVLISILPGEVTYE